MILNSRRSLIILATAAVLTACAPSDRNAAAKNANSGANADVAKSVAAAPTAGALLALDKQATEAYVRGDGEFFEHLLSDRLVMQKHGVRLSKSDVIKMINGVKCEVKEGWAFTQPQMLKIDNDAYVLSYVSDMQGSCTADGKTEKMPSPVRAATVWVRYGKKWQVAFHGENQIVDLDAPPATAAAGEPREDEKVAANVNTAAVPVPAKPTADPITDTLMTAENVVWEAWKAKDARKIEAITAREIAFVDVFGTYFANKAATIKDWTGPLCDVKSFTLTDGVGTSVSPKVGILTLTGTVNGACGGKDLSEQKIYGNSVYVKDGDGWKWAFGFNSPS